MSAVSVPIALQEKHELLIQSDHLQSTSLQARKDTKRLLNWSIPFASLLSGMYLLTRVSPAGAEPVVLSSTSDPLSELGIIEVAEGAAFVVRPNLGQGKHLPINSLADHLDWLAERIDSRAGSPS